MVEIREVKQAGRASNIFCSNSSDSFHFTSSTPEDGSMVLGMNDCLASIALRLG